MAAIMIHQQKYDATHLQKWQIKQKQKETQHGTTND